MFIYGDGHVHLHPDFELPAVFEAAIRRAGSLGAPLLLLLVESQGLDYFGALARLARREAPAEGEPELPAELRRDLRLDATAEPASLAFRRRGEARPAGYLVAGRQLVSSEGIEVLAIAPRPGEPLPADGALPARELVRAVRAREAAAVLPWGLGKWLGARGERVAALAADEALAGDALVLLGDIAHRFWPWPEPGVFRRGLGVLAGTDPLPVPGAERHVGSYGFRVAGRLDPERPAASLLEGLCSRAPLERVGARQSLPQVLLEQARYRWRRRGAPRAPRRAA